MKIKIPDKFKKPAFWAAVLGAAAGYLAGQLPIHEAIVKVVDAITK